MQSYHGTNLTRFDAFSELQDFVERRREEPGLFESFERELGTRLRALENDLKASQLALCLDQVGMRKNDLFQYLLGSGILLLLDGNSRHADLE